MADKTKIEWTDATWNVVNGCTVHSPGCTNCYAMKQAHRFPPRQGLTVKTNGGMVWTGEVRFNEAVLTQPLRWKRPRRIFACAHGDLFHENVPDEWIDRVFAVMALSPQHQFQVLTKRSARMREYCADTYQLRERIGEQVLTLPMPRGGFEPVDWDQPDNPAELNVWPLPNVWLGVSVEDQQRADERVPDLLATPAAVRWLSCEPLLGPVDLWNLGVPHECKHEDAYTEWDTNALVCTECEEAYYLDWVVVGGESGPKARPMHPDWARSLRDQCEAAAVPFLFKQWGEFHPADQLKTEEQRYAMGDMGTALRSGKAHAFDDQWTWKVGKKRAGRVLDGVEHNGFPQVPHG